MTRRCARIRVIGRFELASVPQDATVTIERGAGLFHVRPLRKRRVYTLPLATVAEIVVQRLIKAEVAEKRRSKRKHS